MPLKNVMKGKIYKLISKISACGLVLSILGQSFLSVPAYAMVTNFPVTEFNEGTNDPYESIAVTTPDKYGAYGIHLSNAGQGELWFADNPTISAVSTKYDYILQKQSYGAYGMYFYSNNYMDVLLTNKDHNLAAINIDKVTTIEKDPSLINPDPTEAYGLAAVGSSTAVYTLGATLNISNVKSSLPASDLNDGISVCGVYLNGATLSTEVDAKWHTLGGGGINISNIEASCEDLRAKAYGIYTEGFSSLRTASDININGVKAGGTNEAYGMYMSGMEVCTNGSNINISSINPNPKDGPGTGLYLHGKIFTVKLDSSKQSERGGDIVIKDVNNVGMEIKYTTTPSYVIVTGGGDIVIDGVNGMQIKTYDTFAYGLSTESAKLLLMNAISKEAGALKISNINADTACGISSSGDFLVIGNVYVKMDPNKQNNYSLFSDNGKITLGYLEQAAINKNLEIQLEGNVMAGNTFGLAINNIALANNNSYVWGNFVTKDNSVNNLYLSDGGRWFPVFDSTSHESTDNVNVTLDKNGVIDVAYDSITDGKESYEGREVTADTKRELNFTKLIANDSGGTIKIGTNLANNISDTITVSSVAAGNNTLNLQIAYDPIFATLATGKDIWSGTVDVFTAGDTISLVGKPTDYIFGNKIYRYTPTIAQNGNTWQIISLSAEKMVGYSLYEAINLKGGAVTRTPSEYDLETDVALGDGSEAGNLPEGVTSLGTLTEKDTEPRSFAINGNNHTLDGAGNGGIIVNSGDTLIISDLTVKEFNGSFVTNAGTLEFTGTNTMNNSVKNNGTMNVTGETTFNSDYGVSGSGTITNTGLFTINAGQLGNTIENNKTLTLTGNGGTLAKDITGSGTTVINGAVVANANIANEITINSGKSLTTLANYLGGAVTVADNGQLYLKGKTLEKAVSGSGETLITGDVTSNASIASNTITIGSGMSLSISASLLGGQTTNNGTLTLSDGTLAKAINGTGQTIIDGAVGANAWIENKITINAEKSLTISAGNLGNTVTNSGKVTLTDGTLAEAINGTGDVTITGDVESNANIRANSLHVNLGSTFTTSANMLDIKADSILDDGKLILNAGTLKKAVSGSGVTAIAGSVTANASIATDILTIDNGGTLDIAVDNIKTTQNTVTNNGTLNLLGGTATEPANLSREITGSGNTVVTNGGNVASTARIATNAITITEDGKLTIASENLGSAVTNNGTLKLEGNVVGQNVNGDPTILGTLSLSDGEVSFADGVTIKNQIIETSGILKTGKDHLDATDSVTLKDGTINITNGEVNASYTPNVVNLRNFDAKNGTNKIVFNTMLSKDASTSEITASSDYINISGTATGTLNLDLLNANIFNDENFGEGDRATVELFKTTAGGDITGLRLIGQNVAVSLAKSYIFKPKNEYGGELEVTIGEGSTLYQAINLYELPEGYVPDSYNLHQNVNIHEKDYPDTAGAIPVGETSLGTLARASGEPRNFTINGNGYRLFGDDANSFKAYGGVIVNAGDTLTISNLTAIGFDGAFVKNAGTLNFTDTNYMYNSIENNGTMNITGSTVFTNGAGITGTTGTGKLINSGELNIGASFLTVNRVENGGKIILSGGTLTSTIHSTDAVTGVTIINGVVDLNASIYTPITINGKMRLTASASNIGGAVTNEKGTLNLTDGTLAQTVSGKGATIIAGDVTSNAKIENKITINDGKSLKISAEDVGGVVTNKAGTLRLTGSAKDNEFKILNNIIMGEGDTIIDSGYVEARKKIENKITVGNGSAKTALAISANNITQDVIVNENAQLDLMQGTLTHAISGEGVTGISRGDVKSEAKINTEIYIELGRKLEISADNVGNTIHNYDGTVILSDGTLGHKINDAGSVVIDGAVISNEAITNNITINAEKSLQISASNIGGEPTTDITNNGTLTLTGKSTLGIGDPLNHRIKGSGKTIIAGNISSIAPAIGKISNDMIINGGKSLQIIASNIDGDIEVESNGTLEIYAYTTLLTNDRINNAITGSGETKIKGKIAAKKEISTPTISIEDGELKISAGNVGGVVAISKNKKLVLTGGILRKEVNGSGTTEIDGSVISNEQINTKISINSGKSLSSLANYIGGTVSNSGTLTLTGDTLSHEVSGDGTTEINGAVTFNADVENSITINGKRSLTSSAKHIGGTVSNNGTLTLTGDTLNNAVSGSGKTVIDGTVTFNANVANAITINSGKSLTSSANYIGGTVANNEKLTLTGGTLNNAVAGSGSTVIGNGYVLSNALINNSINLSVAQSSLEISADNIGADKAVTGVGNLYLTGGTLTTQGIGTQDSGENVKIHITGNVVSNEKIYGQSLSISDSPNALLAISAENICISDSLVTNNGTLNLTGGTLAKAVSGSGTTEIDGAVTFNVNVANAITVNDGKYLTSSANYLGGTVSNSGTLTLTGDTLNNAVSGSGETVIDGTVTFDANVANAITINGEKSLTSSANYIGGTVSNSGNLTLGDGTLKNAVNGSGETVIDGNVTSTVSIANAITINSGKTLTIAAENIGGDVANDVTNNGTLNLVGKMLSHNVSASENKRGTLNFTLGEKSFADDVTLTNQNICVTSLGILKAGKDHIDTTDNVTLKNGTIDITNGSAIALTEDNANVVEINDFSAKDGTNRIVFNTKVSKTGETAQAISDSIKVAGTVTTPSTVKIDIARANIYNDGSFNVNDEANINLFTGNVSGLTLVGGTVVSSPDLAYKFTATEKEGELHIQAIQGCTLYAAINLPEGSWTQNNPPVAYTFSDSVTLGDSAAGFLPTGATSLGTLAEKDSEAREFTINGNGYTLNGADYGGVAVNEGDTLILSDLTVKKFKDDVFVTNAGTLEFNDTNTMESSVVNNGAMNVTGATTFALSFGVSGDGVITNTGSLTIGASNLGNETTNNGTLTLKDGTLDSAVSGDGQTIIDGTVMSKKLIANAITINSLKFLGISANNIGGRVTNEAGTLTLSDGTLNYAVSGGGRTVVDGYVVANTKIANEITINGGKLLKISAGHVAGDVTNSGTLILTGGILKHAVAGYNTNSSTVIDGIVISAASIADKITINADKRLVISAGNLGGDVTNNGKLSLLDGTLSNAVSGSGETMIAGDVTSGKSIANKIVINSGKSLNISADNIGGDVANKGTLTLGTGTLDSDVSGNGSTVIAGTVTSNASIANAITIDGSNSLKISASNIGGLVTNNATGTLALSDGELTYDVNGNGSTVIDGDVTSSANIENTITINDGKSLNISANYIGNTVTNTGTLTLTDGALTKAVTGSGVTIIDGTVTSDVSIANAMTINVDSALAISANNVGNTVANDGKLTLIGGSLVKAVSGSGTTVIDGPVSVTDAEDGGSIANKILINKDWVLLTDASKVGGLVSNNGTLQLTGTNKTLSYAVSGNGTTKITGTITANALIANAIIIDPTSDSNSLTIAADNVGGAITNTGAENRVGKLTLLDGKLKYAINEGETQTNDETIIDGDVLASASITTNALTIKANRSLAIAADNIKITATGDYNEVTNNGTLSLYTGTLNSAVTGIGSTVIAGAVTSNARIANAITIGGSNSLKISAGKVGGAVANSGKLILTGGASDNPVILEKAINGTGETIIDGYVNAKEKIANKITIYGERTVPVSETEEIVLPARALTIAAGNVGGNVKNDGTLTLAGGASDSFVTLANVVNGTGKTIIDGYVKATEEIANKITVNSGKSLTISAENVGGDVINSGATLTLFNGDGVLAHDVSADSDNRGTLNLGSGEKSFEKFVTIKNQDITTSGKLKTGIVFDFDKVQNIQNNVTMNSATIDIANGAANVDNIPNIVYLHNFDARSGTNKIAFNTKLWNDGIEDRAESDCIYISGAVENGSKLKINIGKMNIYNDGSFVSGGKATISLFTGNVSNLTLVGGVVVESPEIAYIFTKVAGDGNEGKLNIEAITGCTLYEAINLSTPRTQDYPPAVYGFTGDVTLHQDRPLNAGYLPATNGDSLGTLTEKDSEAREFTINGNGFTLNGAGKGGVIVNSNDTLILSDLKVTGFKDVTKDDDTVVKSVAVDNRGTLEFDGTNYMAASVINTNSGKVNVTGDVTFLSGFGIDGGSLNNTGSLTIEVGKLAVNSIENDGNLSLYGTGTLAKEINGTGQTIIDGDITSSAAINNSILINNNRSLTTDADLVGGVVTNNGLFTLTGAYKTLAQDVNGEGRTVIDGSITSSALITNTMIINKDNSLNISASNVGGAVANSGTLTLTDGTLNCPVLILEGNEVGTTVINGNVLSNALIANTITINGSKSLQISASNIGGIVTNNAGTLTLLDGELAHVVNGNGSTIIDGDVTSGANIGNEITIMRDKSLTISANHVGNTVTNNGMLTLESGTLNEAVSGNGSTVINGAVKSDAKIENNIEILTNKALEISVGNLGGDVANDGALTLTGGASDSFASFAHNVTGNGLTEIDGFVKSDASIENSIRIKLMKSLKISANNVGGTVLNNGTLALSNGILTNPVLGIGVTEIDGIVASSAYIANAIKINNGSALEISATDVGGNALVMDGATLRLANGILRYETSGNGSTVIAGDVISNARIATETITVKPNASLEINANNIGNEITNNGTLALIGGTLTEEVKSTVPTRNGSVQLKYGVTLDAQLSNQNIIASQGYSKVTQESYIANNDLTFNGGGFDFQDNKVSNYVVRNINLDGDGYLKLDVDLAAKAMDAFSIEGSSNITGNSKIHVTALTLLTDAASDVTKVLFTDDSNLRNAVVYDGVTEGLHVTSSSLLYKVAYDKETGDFTFTKMGASETTKSILDTALAINMAWLENVNNLQKRLGDLRSGEESNTGWVRFQRNMDDLNMGRKVNVSGNLYQIGYDFALQNDKTSRGYFGLSFERMDGNQSFKLGGGDLKSTSVGAYYTKIYNSGHYFDFILRYGRYESDTTSYDAGITTKLDYAVNGVTLSGEYGYRANISKNGFYLEPQTEFIYGYLGGAKKTSNTGHLATIDSTNHFVTRLGLSLGQQVNNFNYYLKTSYYHDFVGSSNITYGDASCGEDCAKNWWEVSLGGGWNVTNTSYFYAELTKHFKDISNSLNFNLGFRFTL